MRGTGPGSGHVPGTVPEAWTGRTLVQPRGGGGIAAATVRFAWATTRSSHVPCAVATVQAASDRLWDGSRKEFLFPEDWVLPVELLRRQLRAVRELERDGVPLVRHDELELDQVGALPRGRVDHGEGAVRDLRHYPRNRALRQLARDLLCLGVAHQHLRRYLVCGAAADGVVRGVLEHA